MARAAVEKNISYDDVRNRYYVCMSGISEDGKRMRKYRTFKTLTAARAALREFRREQEELRLEEGHAGITVREWLDYWMETIVRPNRAVTTSYSYQSIIENHLDPAFGDTLLRDLSPMQIQRYYVDVQRLSGLSPNTVRRHHDLLSSALRMAVRQGALLYSPMDRVEPPRPQMTETCFYNKEQMRTLYRLLEGNPLEVPVKLAGSLGLRREELCGLRWSNVDFERRVICIREARTCCGSKVVEKETKNRSSIRTLYMSDDMVDLLRREKERQEKEGKDPAGHVVVDREGQPIPPNVLSVTFTRFIKANNLPRITMHGLRHSFATVASSQGLSLFDIGKAMGHSTPATTGRIYTHLVDRTHEETMVKVAAALQEPPKDGSD